MTVTMTTPRTRVDPGGMPSPPDPEVPEKAKRRRFSAEYKLAILREADGCTARPRHEQPTATPEAIGEYVGYGKCIHAARRYSFRGSPSSSRWWTRTGGCLLMRFTADGQVRQDPGSWPRAEGLPIEFEQVSTVA